MPRIHAASLAEHVAQQRATVLRAAIELFVARGYGQVGMGDIAAEVGLARNSLYRYFPDKAHILLEWFREELPVQAQRSARALAGDGTPVERIGRWALDQLDYAQQPEHGLIASLAELEDDLDPDARAELADSHRTVLAPLDATLREAGIRSRRERTATAALIGGLVLAASRAEGARDDAVVRRRLLAGIGGLVEGQPAP